MTHGLDSRDAELARDANLATLRGECGHDHLEPVELWTGEIVAAICPDCHRGVPVTWLTSSDRRGCDVCDGLPCTVCGSQ